MIIPDTNLLIYAYDSSSPCHTPAKQWWEQVLSRYEPIGIPWIVILAYTRLVTHPTICHNPLDTEEVRQQTRFWLSFPHVRMLTTSEETLNLYFSLLQQIEMGGNLTTDALIAAHAIEHAAVVYSNDRDFERFSGLRWKNPLA